MTFISFSKNSAKKNKKKKKRKAIAIPFFRYAQTQ